MVLLNEFSEKRWESNLAEMLYDASPIQ